MNWSVDFAPMLPGPFLWVAAIVGAVLVTLLLLRRSRGALLRALALAALLLAMLNPTLREEERERIVPLFMSSTRFRRIARRRHDPPARRRTARCTSRGRWRCPPRRTRTCSSRWVSTRARQRGTLDTGDTAQLTDEGSAAAALRSGSVLLNFFYDHPLGPSVNAIMSGMRMFPPVMRDKEKKPFNNYSVARCIEELNREDIGTVLGIHPEGHAQQGRRPVHLPPRAARRRPRRARRHAREGHPGVRPRHGSEHPRRDEDELSSPGRAPRRRVLRHADRFRRSPPEGEHDHDAEARGRPLPRRNQGARRPSASRRGDPRGRDPDAEVARRESARRASGPRPRRANRSRCQRRAGTALDSTNAGDGCTTQVG